MASSLVQPAAAAAPDVTLVDAAGDATGTSDAPLVVESPALAATIDGLLEELIRIRELAELALT